VTSNLTAGADNSGIGSAGAAVNGLDVAGTINGEAATGSGQFLMGNTGNATTEGLQIQYTGNTTGAVGSVTLNRGIASLLSYRMESFTDSVNGLLTSVDRALTDQIEDLNDRITSTQERLAVREETLRKRFTAMEEAIGRLNAQSSQFGAVFGGQR
jgi:flagellar hook-associated protein 2